MAGLPGQLPPSRIHLAKQQAPALTLAGMPCGVDQRANDMMPHAVRSNRATNLFHTLKASPARDWWMRPVWQCRLAFVTTAMRCFGMQLQL